MYFCDCRFVVMANLACRRRVGIVCPRCCTQRETCLTTHRGAQSGPPTEPRPAASVILLRRGRQARLARASRCCSGSARPHAQLHGRTSGSSPAARSTGASTDRRGDYRATAAARARGGGRRVTLDEPAELVPFSRWITPAEVKVRYDTRFYLALAPPHCSPEPDGDGDRRGRLVRAARRARAPRRRRDAARLSHDQAARGPARSSAPPRRRWPPPASASVEPILPKVGRERRRAAHPAARRLGDSGSKPPAAGRARSGSPARPRTRSCRAAGRPRARRPPPRAPRTTSRSRRRRTRERRRPSPPRCSFGPGQVVGEQVGRGRVAAAVADHQRQLVPALAPAPGRAPRRPRRSARR